MRSFQVLFVYTANLCRSPLALFSARQHIVWNRAWFFNSAGVSAVDDQPMHPSTARALEREGIDVNGFRTKRLNAGLIESADLVLTAEAAHRSSVVALDPAARDRTFTLAQFAALCARLPAGSIAVQDGAELIGKAHALRGLVPRLAPDELDIEDPIGRRRRTFDRCRRRIDGLLSDIAQPLAAHARVDF